MVTSEIISTVAIRVSSQQTQDSVLFVNGQEAEEKHHYTALKGFFKLQPKVLGTVQIMFGVIVVFLGVVLSVSEYGYPAILVHSGITYWGSFIYISAGSLSVSAQNKFRLVVVKASLGMNVFSAITAGIAIALMCGQIHIILSLNPSLYVEYFMLRIVGIMLVFTVPQFFISICISAFACKVACNRDSTVGC